MAYTPPDRPSQVAAEIVRACTELAFLKRIPGLSRPCSSSTLIGFRAGYRAMLRFAAMEGLDAGSLAEMDALHRLHLTQLTTPWWKRAAKGDIKARDDIH